MPGRRAIEAVANVGAVADLAELSGTEALVSPWKVGWHVARRAERLVRKGEGGRCSRSCGRWRGDASRKDKSEGEPFPEHPHSVAGRVRLYNAAVWVLLLAMDAHDRTGNITKVAHLLRRAGGTRQASSNERTCRSDSRKRSGKEIRLDARPTSVAAGRGRWCDLRVLSCRLRETALPDGLHRKSVTRAPLI
jgi:hypothetical protein